jgi:thymidylate synthase
MMLGAPHDVAGFALLQAILAGRLGYQIGTLTHSISNAHIYDIHYEHAWQLIERENNHPEIFFEAQPNYFDRAQNADIELVKEVAQKLSNQYNPEGPIKGMKIVL